MPNVVIGTENVVTHALPNLSEEKKEEEKEEEKREVCFFSLDKLGSGWVATFSVPITTLDTSGGSFSKQRPFIMWKMKLKK